MMHLGVNEGSKPHLQAAATMLEAWCRAADEQGAQGRVVPRAMGKLGDMLMRSARVAHLDIAMVRDKALRKFQDRRKASKRDDLGRVIDDIRRKGSDAKKPRGPSRGKQQTKRRMGARKCFSCGSFGHTQARCPFGGGQAPRQNLQARGQDTLAAMKR